MNKKIMLLIPFFALALFILSCSPESGLTPEEQELFGEESALAGQAIALGCRDVSVESCTDIAGSAQTTTASRTDRSGRVTPGRSTSFADRCQSGNTAFDYSCASATSLRLCRTQCEGSETCNAGRCATTCGNLRIDRGETCSSCPADVRCATGQNCQEGQCVRIRTPTVTVTGETSPIVNVVTTESATIVQVNDIPVLQVAPTTDISRASINVDGSRVVVTGISGTHSLCVSNTQNNGGYVCPSATTLADVSPSCSGVISFTDAECRSGIGGCTYDSVANCYRIAVSGSGGDESPLAPGDVEICDGIDNNANGVIDEGCPVPSVNRTNATGNRSNSS